MMKVAVTPDLDSKFLPSSKSHTLIRQKEIVLDNVKFYQKLFVVLISLSTFLIIPESPRELENICEMHNSRTLCNVW